MLGGLQASSRISLLMHRRNAFSFGVRHAPLGYLLTCKPFLQSQGRKALSVLTRPSYQWQIRFACSLVPMAWLVLVEQGWPISCFAGMAFVPSNSHAAKPCGPTLMV